MYKASELYDALNTSAITNLLDTYMTKPAIFSDTVVIPQNFTGSDYIVFYLSEPVNNNLDYGYYSRTVNCRAKTQAESEAIASAVVSVINRKAISGGWINCETLATLPPADDTDVFNTPLTVVIKA